MDNLSLLNLNFGNGYYGFSLLSYYKRGNIYDKEGWVSILAFNYDFDLRMFEIDLLYFCIEIKI